MAYNADITPYVSGKRSIVPGNVVAEADSNTVNAETTSINLNVYNLKGANFALTVFGVKLYVIRDGARVDLTIPAFASWINAASFPMVNQPAVAAVNETKYEIGANGYMSANIAVGAASNLMVGDKLYAELDATFTGTDAGYETQPFLLVQGQDKTLLNYNNDIHPYVSGVRNLIPGKVQGAASANTITQSTSSIYVNLYSVKGPDFTVTAYGVRLYALRGTSRVQVVVPPLSQFTQAGAVAKSVTTPAMQVVSGVFVTPRPENAAAAIQSGNATSIKGIAPTLDATPPTLRCYPFYADNKCYSVREVAGNSGKMAPLEGLSRSSDKFGRCLVPGNSAYPGDEILLNGTNLTQTTNLTVGGRILPFTVKELPPDPIRLNAFKSQGLFFNLPKDLSPGFYAVSLQNKNNVRPYVEIVSTCETLILEVRERIRIDSVSPIQAPVGEFVRLIGTGALTVAGPDNYAASRDIQVFFRHH